MNKNTWIIIGAVVVIALVVWFMFAQSSSQTSPVVEDTVMTEEETSMDGEDAMMEEENAMEDDGAMEEDTMMEGETTTQY